MLDNETKRRIDTARDILVGKIPDPKSQVEQITIALIYKFMADMDAESVEFGGTATFFTGEYQKYSWANLLDAKLGGHEVLALYGEAIVKLNQNPNLPQLFRDIFKNAYLPYRDAETLKLFLKTINGFIYDHSERLGDAFEYLLSVLGSQGDAGQFRTPRHIIDFMVSILQPKKGETICDPACGTAGFLISSYKYILKENTAKQTGDLLTPADRKKLMQNFTGYDISPDMVRLSLVNLYLHNFTSPQVHEYDTLTSEDRWGDTFDIILANPPFMTPKGGIKPHKKFSITANRSEVLFADYIAEHINPVSGRAGVVVPEGVIFKSETAFKNLRKQLVDKHYLYAVVSLPAGIFQPYSNVKTSILLMDKIIAKKCDNILFVKIENDGFDLGTQRRAIAKNDLPDALKAILEYKEAILGGRLFVNNTVNMLVTPKKTIKGNGDYNLNGERYQVAEKQHSKWEMVRLGDVADVISGQSPESEFYNNDKTGLPFYQGRTEFGKVYIREPKIWTTKITKTANRNDILMSVRAPVGPVNIATQEICIGRGIAAIRITDKILLKYLFTYLDSIQGYIKGNGGAVFDSINRDQILDIKIPLPSLSVQKGIVVKIEGYQRIIDGAKQVVENYKPLIEINESWEMVELGKLITTQTGGTPSKAIDEYWQGEIPWVSPKDMKVDFISDAEDHINELAVNNSSTKLVPKNTILIVVRSGILQHTLPIGITLKSVSFNQDIIAITITSKQIISKFLFYYLKSTSKTHIETGIKPGVTVQSFHNNYFKSLSIPLPSLSTQQQIVEQIEKEQQLVNANKELITIYEQKIKEEIAKLWITEKEENKYKVNEEEMSVVAEQESVYLPVKRKEKAINDWAIAMLVHRIQTKLSNTYGDVGLQKTVFNTLAYNNTVSDFFNLTQKDFVNHHFGTYSKQLSESLKSNQYLTKQPIHGKPVFVVNEAYKEQVSKAVALPENKVFIDAIDKILDIHTHSFINRETDKIELLNTITKLIIDLQTMNLNEIYTSMEKWSIEQFPYVSKADKFSKEDTKRIIELIQQTGLDKSLL